MDGVIVSKRCTRCLRVRFFEEYAPGDGRYGFASHCRDCRRAGQRSYKRGHRSLPSIWTTELTARLHDMHAYGMWPKEIAPVLGLTRNSVVGKMWREGLVTLEAPTSTTEDRLEKLTRNMDAALAADAVLKRIPPPKKIAPAKLSWSLVR